MTTTQQISWTRESFRLTSSHVSVYFDLWSSASCWLLSFCRLSVPSTSLRRPLIPLLLSKLVITHCDVCLITAIWHAWIWLGLSGEIELLSVCPFWSCNLIAFVFVVLCSVIYVIDYCGDVFSIWRYYVVLPMRVYVFGVCLFMWQPFLETCRVHYHEKKNGDPGDNMTLLVEGEFWQQVEIDVRTERYMKLHTPPILGTIRSEVVHDMDSVSFCCLVVII